MISTPLLSHLARPRRPTREKLNLERVFFMRHVKFSGLPFGNGIPSYNFKTPHQVSGDEWIKLT